MFDRDLIYLKEKCCPISYQQLSDYYLNGTELEPNAVHISFDDGLAECFSVARPLLLKHGIPCTFFITTDLIDNQTMFYRHKVSSCIEKFRKADDTWRETAYRKFRTELGVEITNSDQFERWAKSLE